MTVIPRIVQDSQQHRLLKGAMKLGPNACIVLQPRRGIATDMSSWNTVLLCMTSPLSCLIRVCSKRLLPMIGASSLPPDGLLESSKSICNSAYTGNLNCQCRLQSVALIEDLQRDLEDSKNRRTERGVWRVACQ